ncbi:MAG TPA: flavoprotein [Candidatus Kapabacteria bacterium]|nr:flavoprotein [Candidatus Kapabacteria bacterium]
MNNTLNNKRILLGVTGSIAAYKSPLLLRELIKLGANVQVIMTPASSNFVSPTVMSNLSHNNVIIDMFDSNNQNDGAWHIKLAHQSDLMIIAPCSLSTLSKIAYGMCDNALTTLTIALENSVPLLISPAMDSTMWTHPATQRAVKQVVDDGAILIPPIDGELSSGLIGPGRLPDIPDLVRQVEVTLNKATSTNRYNYTNYKAGEAIEKEPKKIEHIPNLIDTPIYPISNDIDKDKFNSELEFHKLKNKLV